MDKQKAINLIMCELRKADLAQGNWPTDPLQWASLLNDKTSEVFGAAIDVVHRGRPKENVIVKAAQTGALVIKMLLQIEKEP